MAWKRSIAWASARWVPGFFTRSRSLGRAVPACGASVASGAANRQSEDGDELDDGERRPPLYATTDIAEVEAACSPPAIIMGRPTCLPNYADMVSAYKPSLASSPHNTPDLQGEGRGDGWCERIDASTRCQPHTPVSATAG
jgi:hypothetical protein